MTLKHQSKVDQYSDWLAGEMDLIIRTMTDRNPIDFMTYCPDPNYKLITHSNDIIGTAALLTSPYKNSYVQCGLSNIDKKLERSILDIDYFFMRMHILGHSLINLIRPSLDNEDIPEAAFIEVTSTLFASIACHHYYGLRHLSPIMATELSNVFEDQKDVDLEFGVTYTNEDKFHMMQEMVDLMLENDKAFLQ